jgi:RNA polymerase sigma-70 factor, ECF subfamily
MTVSPTLGGPTREMDQALQQLVALAKGGDRRAMEAVLERFLPTVHRFVAAKLGSSPADVDDVVQETLIGAAASIHRLRGENEPALVSWMLGIARFKVADHFRRSAGRGSITEPESDHSGVVMSVEDEVLNRARDRYLLEALGRLTNAQEEVLTLKFILGYDNEGVAAITGQTVGAVKALQHRGLASLSKLVGQEQGMW